MIESQFRIASKILILGSDLTSSPWTESYQKNRFGLEKHKKRINSGDAHSAALVNEISEARPGLL